MLQEKLRGPQFSCFASGKIRKGPELMQKWFQWWLCRRSLHHARASSFLGLFSKTEELSNSGLLGIFFIGLVSRKHISHLLPCPLGAWVSQQEAGRVAHVFYRSWGWNNAARGLSRWRCLDYLSSLLHSRVAHTILWKKHLSKYKHGLLCLRGEPSVTQGNFVTLHWKSLLDDSK